VILVLVAKDAKRVGPAYVIGWMLGIAIIAGLVILLADPANFESDDNSPSTTASLFQLILGALLLLAGVRDWRGRPKEGDPAKLPKWMNGIDSFSPRKTFGFSLLVSTINPKNLALALGGGLAIAQAGLPTGKNLIAILIFVLIASASVIVPVTWYFVAPESAGRTLKGWRVWLEQNNAAVMSVLFLVFGMILIGRGIAGLTS
jgi:threonine/homoserine/homoserine lactone efflux protein